MSFWEGEEFEKLLREIAEIRATQLANKQKLDFIESQQVAILKALKLISKAVGIGSAVKLKLQWGKLDDQKTSPIVNP